MQVNQVRFGQLPSTARKPQVKELYWFMQGAEYSRPITIGEALGGILQPAHEYGKRFYGLLVEENKIRGFLENLSNLPEILNTKVLGIKGFGSSAIAFETDEHKIMKLSHKNHFPQNRPVEDFDVPIEKSGNSGDCFYYLEKKLDIMYDIPKEMEAQFESLKTTIKLKGYDLFDFHPAQTGFCCDTQRFLLVDPECAVPKPQTLIGRLQKYTQRVVEFVKRGSLV